MDADLQVETDRAFVTRLSLLAAGSFMLYFASQYLWSRSDLLWSPPLVVECLLAYLLAFVSIFAGIASRWPGRYAWLALAAALFALLAGYSTRLLSDRPLADTTDAALFSDYAARLQMLGINPYQWDMSDAYSAYRISDFYQTSTLSGSFAHSVNYPALHFLLIVPFKWLRIADARVPYLLAFIGILLVLFFRSPRWARSLVFLPVMVNAEFLDYTFGRVTDIVWAFFLVAMVAAWRRPALRAGLFGLACAYKQLPWFLAIFLLVRLWMDDQDPDASPRVQRVLRFFGISAGVFLLINGPYLLADFSAWVKSVFEPLTSSLVYLGSGLSVLTQLSILPLPKLFYTLAMLGVFLALLVVYIVRFASLRDALWIFPAIILWFSYRSLQSYFIYWVLVLVMALIEQRKPAPPQPSTARDEAPAHPAWRKIRLPLRAALLRLERQAVVIPLGLAIGLIAAAGVFLLSAPKIEVRVIDVLPSSSVHQVDRLVLEIQNRSSASLQPRIAVQKGGWQPYAWVVDGGPQSLAPGESGVYQAHTDLPYRMINLVDGALLVVTDAGGRYELRGTAKIVPDYTYLDPDIVYNPNYVHGAQANALPYGWGLDARTSAGPTLSVQSTDQAFQAIEIAFTPAAGSGVWETAGITQTIPFPSNGMKVWVMPSWTLSLAGSQLESAYGVEFRDDLGHVLWILYGPEAREGYLAENHYYQVRLAPINVWSEQRIDLGAIYERLGWQLPSLQRVTRGDLALFSRMVSVRLFVGVNRADPAGEVRARFGPLLVDQAADPAGARIEAALRSPAEYFQALGDYEQMLGNEESARAYYDRSTWYQGHVDYAGLELGN